MVSEEYRVGLYIAIPVYFFILACSAWWGHRRMKHMTTTKGCDHLSSHYLGGRTFGPWMTAGTAFATVFSGYTVVGVPNEAYFLGYHALRWMAATSMLLAGIIGTGIRLRKASIVRNHQSPVDFVTDRFQSQYLRYTIVFIQTLTSLIYLSAQVVALKNTFTSMFGFSQDDDWPVIVMMMIILMFEWVGGLSSVALTDCIQAVVMIASFIMLPCVIKKHFGGWSSLDPTTYPRPDFYQTPSREAQWNFWQFSISLIAGFCFPHSVQRVYAARDLQSLKTGWTFLAFSPWFTMFVSIFIGTVGVQMLADAGVSEDPASPFTAILEVIMSKGGFAQAVGIIAYTASLAAIMSTADSLIIAGSQLITVEIIYPSAPNADPSLIAWTGRTVSLFFTALALVTGILWEGGVGALAAINFPVTMQAMPAFMVGLYAANDRWDFHPWSLATAALCSTVYVFLIYFFYISPDAGIENKLPIGAGMTGVTINIILACLLEAVYRCFFRRQIFKNLTKKKGGGGSDNNHAPTSRRSQRRSRVNTASSGEATPAGDSTGGGRHGSSSDNGGRSSVHFSDTSSSLREEFSPGRRLLLHPYRPKWDIPKLNRFGNHTLTPSLLNKMMEGVPEPFANWWYFLLYFVAVTFATPFVAENEPAMNPDGTFVSMPRTVNGLPWWAFKEIIVMIIPYLLIGMTLWQMPYKFPFDKRSIDKNGVDLDVVEMTPTEMGRRASYDEPNELFHSRRFTIRSHMFNLGIQETIDEEDGDESTSVPEEGEAELGQQQGSSRSGGRRPQEEASARSVNRLKLSALILGETSADINHLMEELYDPPGSDEDI